VKKYAVSEAKPGMKLGEDINASQGATLVPKGTILTQRIIYYLMDWGIDSILVIEESESATKYREEKQLDFKKKYLDTTQKVMEYMEGLKGSKAMKVEEVKEIAEELIMYASDIDSVKLITDMKNKDHYTYQHSMNVGIYASLLGRWLGYTKEALKNISMAGLLHDIGKMRIPDEIISKPGPLTNKEFEIVKNHSVFGYELLKHNEVSVEVAIAVLQHHERENGTGYPFKLTGTKIHPYSKIVTVADIFDAITSNRVYQPRKSPFTAVKELKEGSFNDLDPKVASTFFHRIADFFIGSTVIFNDGTFGEIVFLNKHEPTKPLVKLGNHFVDLSKDKNKEIIDVLVF